MANRINLNQTSFHGAGAIKEIAAEVKVRGLKKALVCSDPDLIKFNVTTKVTKVLDDAGLEYELYSDIKPNPTIQNVQHGVEAFKKALIILSQSAEDLLWIHPKQSVSSLPIRNSKM